METSSDLPDKKEKYRSCDSLSPLSNIDWKWSRYRVPQAHFTVEGTKTWEKTCQIDFFTQKLLRICPIRRKNIGLGAFDSLYQILIENCQDIGPYMPILVWKVSKHGKNLWNLLIYCKTSSDFSDKKEKWRSCGFWFSVANIDWKLSRYWVLQAHFRVKSPKTTKKSGKIVLFFLKLI